MAAKPDPKSTRGSRNVKNGRSRGEKKQALTPRLDRTTFSTSRTMDFFSKKELTTQTGHDVSEWPLVYVKEVVDNALDACEEADVAPVVHIAADAAGITISDNGPGLPEETLKGALDFTIRASDKEAYISPCRGAQGNALMTILPMPWVVDADSGKLILRAHGKRHTITCGCDPISQQAVVHDDAAEEATEGTSVRIEWGPRTIERNFRGQNGQRWTKDVTVWPFDEMSAAWIEGRFRRLVEGFAVFNPHASITLDWFGEKTMWDATNPSWEKWQPSRPTSSHWYEQRHLERLIGAYITFDRQNDSDRLASDFIAEFDGLAGSQKRAKVLDDANLRRANLSALVDGDRFRRDTIASLLEAMQRRTRPVNPKRLGIIGEEHLRTRLLDMGVEPNSFRYSRKLAKDGLPWVLESAFGWLGDEAQDDRRIYAGANWSAAIKNPFRSFGATGEGLEAALSDMRAGADEPVVFVMHLAHPRVEYVDRGKSALVVGE